MTFVGALYCLLLVTDKTLLLGIHIPMHSKRGKGQPESMLKVCVSL